MTTQPTAWLPDSATRELWLMSCTKELRRYFDVAGFSLPDRIRVSCSWPSKGGLAKRRKRIGEAWSDSSSADQHFEIFISPTLQDSAEVAATLVHELVHCAVGLSEKHNKKFGACARGVGLEGKMTATKASSELTDNLNEIIGRLGNYPHAKLVSNSTEKTQTTRYLKVKCWICGCTVRMTRKWIEEVGTPSCACGGVMKQEGCGDGN